MLDSRHMRVKIRGRLIRDKEFYLFRLEILKERFNVFVKLLLMLLYNFLGMRRVFQKGNELE